MSLQKLKVNPHRNGEGFNLLKIVTGRPSYSNLYSILCKNKCKGDSLCLIITVSIVKITKGKS